MFDSYKASASDTGWCWSVKCMVCPVVTLGCRQRFKPIWLRPGRLLQSVKLVKLVILLRGSPMRWLGVQWVGTLLKGVWEWSALLEASESVVNSVWAKLSCTGGGTGGGGKLNPKNWLGVDWLQCFFPLSFYTLLPLNRPLDARSFGSIPWCFRRTVCGVRLVFGATNEAYIRILGFISMNRHSIWRDSVWTQVMFHCGLGFWAING
jgi:hypothetical protein